MRRAIRRASTVATAHSALANPLVMEAANNLSSALTHGGNNKTGPEATVEVAARPNRMGVRIHISKGQQVDEAAWIVQSLLGNDDDGQWELLAAKGIRKGPRYSLQLADRSARDLEVHLKLSRGSSTSSTSSSTSSMNDVQVVVDAPALTSETARVIATAITSPPTPADQHALLEALEQRVEPLVEQRRGDSGAAAAAAANPHPSADELSGRKKAQTEQLNPDMKLVPWRNRDAVAARNNDPFIEDIEEEEEVAPAAAAGIERIDRIDEALAQIAKRLDALDTQLAGVSSDNEKISNSSKARRKPTAGGVVGSRSSAEEEAFASAEEAAAFLSELGAKVIHHDDAAGSAPLDWSSLAGSASLRAQVEESLVLPMKHPNALLQITAGTRADAAPASSSSRNSSSAAALPRPPSMLFYGPPGTGKTSAARMAAQEAALPLVYAPLETLVSKWVGQGEQQLAGLFEAASALGPSVIFVDELDALAGSREKELHEASRRMLSVLLRRMDGLDASGHTAMIGATNRPQDLDAALLSRFDVRIYFASPDAEARADIFARYAKQLTPLELTQLARGADGLSGRDILDVCKQTERRWAAYVLRNGLLREGQVDAAPLPPLAEYQAAVERRLGLDA